MKRILPVRLFVSLTLILFSFLISTNCSAHKVHARIVVLWNQGFPGGHFNVMVQIKSDTAFRLGNFKLKLLYNPLALTFIKDTTLKHYCCNVNHYDQDTVTEVGDTIIVKCTYTGSSGNGTLLDTSYNDSINVHQYNFTINAGGIGDTTGLRLALTTIFFEDDNTTVASNGSFGNFDRDNGIVLPISLLNFSANPEGNNKVQLNWSTATEENSDYFAIERSEDALNFTDVGKIAAKGNSINTSYYQYVDLLTPEITSGTSTTYYRLKETDENGSYTYSEISAVSLAGSPTSLIISPNPATSDLTLSQTSSGTIAIYNTIGQAVIRQDVNKNEQHISLSNLPVGLYLLQFTSVAGETQAYRFVKQ